MVKIQGRNRCIKDLGGRRHALRAWVWMRFVSETVNKLPNGRRGCSGPERAVLWNKTRGAWVVHGNMVACLALPGWQSKEEAGARAQEWLGRKSAATQLREAVHSVSGQGGGLCSVG